MILCFPAEQKILQMVLVVSLRRLQDFLFQVTERKIIIFKNAEKHHCKVVFILLQFHKLSFPGKSEVHYSNRIPFPSFQRAFVSNKEPVGLTLIHQQK